jgi:hypothetical protein
MFICVRYLTVQCVSLVKHAQLRNAAGHIIMPW